MSYELIAVISMFMLAVGLVGLGEHAKSKVPLRSTVLGTEEAAKRATEDYQRQQTMITLLSRGAAVIVIAIAFFAFMM